MTCPECRHEEHTGRCRAGVRVYKTNGRGWWTVSCNCEKESGVNERIMPEQIEGYPRGTIGYERRRILLEARYLCRPNERSVFTRWYWRRRLRQFEEADRAWNTFARDALGRVWRETND